MLHTILIVEDDHAIRSVLAKRLQQESFDVLEADNGQAGLDIALDKHPDIILLDIILPVMDGLTLLKKLRDDTWGKTADVIMLTNLSDAANVADALSKGVQDFLVKSDWKMEDLVAMIKQKLHI